MQIEAVRFQISQTTSLRVGTLVHRFGSAGMGWLLLLHLSHSFAVPYRTSPQWNFHLQVLSYLKQSIISSYSCGHREWKEVSSSAESFPLWNKPCLPIWITQHSLHNFHFCHQPWHWMWELFWARSFLITFPNSQLQSHWWQVTQPKLLHLRTLTWKIKGNKIFQKFPLEAGHEEKMAVMRKQAGNHMVTGREETEECLCTWVISRLKLLMVSFPSTTCNIFSGHVEGSAANRCGKYWKTPQKTTAQKHTNTTKRHTH